ncbi:MAG: tetratricopeptide repeat protein [Halioglobus sp.]
MKHSALLLWAVLLTQAGPTFAHSGDQVSIDRLTQVIVAHPEQQSLFIKRGAIYSHAGRWQLAESDFQRAYRLGDPREVSFELGLMRFRQGKYPQAQTQFSLYLSIHPGAAEALLFRARAAQAAGAPQMALADFQTYFTLVEQPHPGDVRAAAMLMAQGPDPELAAALALIDRIMANAGLQPQLQRYAITLELQRGEFLAALRRCAQMEASLGGSPEWQVEMAELLLQTHRHDEATAMLEQAQLQLEGLKITPARQALRVKIEQLKYS